MSIERILQLEWIVTIVDIALIRRGLQERIEGPKVPREFLAFKSLNFVLGRKVNVDGAADLADEGLAKYVATGVHSREFSV